MNYILIFLILNIIILSIAAQLNPSLYIGFLCLIALYTKVALLACYIGLNYIGLLIITIYVGAVAVLLLFTVMLLNLRLSLLKLNINKTAAIGIILGLILLYGLVGIINLVDIHDYQPIGPINTIENIKLIAGQLYTKYNLGLQLSGLILILSIISSIALTIK